MTNSRQHLAMISLVCRVADETAQWDGQTHAALVHLARALKAAGTPLEAVLTNAVAAIDQTQNKRHDNAAPSGPARDHAETRSRPDTKKEPVRRPGETISTTDWFDVKRINTFTDRRGRRCLTAELYHRESGSTIIDVSCFDHEIVEKILASNMRQPRFRMKVEIDDTANLITQIL